MVFFFSLLNSYEGDGWLKFGSCIGFGVFVIGVWVNEWRSGDGMRWGEDDGGQCFGRRTEGRG